MKRPALRDRCRELRPACFAPVMATGIVSKALAQSGARTVSLLLFGIAAALYLALLVAAGLKAAYHPDALRAELAGPDRLFGHFTLVAAGGVLAGRLDHGTVRLAAGALLALAGTVWAALAGAAARLLRRGARTALRQADGTWFLATVGLQSLVLTGATLYPSRPVLATALALWTTGVLLYAATLTAVARRLRHAPPAPADLASPYWITMGAVAISVLTGAHLLGRTALLPHPARTPLAVAVTGLWAWATALIPVLLAAGVWRHRRHRVPLGCEPALWSIVFPVGMYATATARLAAARHLGPLAAARHPLAWTALAVWLTVTACRLHQVLPATASPAPTGDRPVDMRDQGS
ncbi:tellurite resistance/C4-dicarboxylate transporter family protein [Streptomyces fumanus]|uniref:Tellurite resistance protein permease n=1 Tax=Streptomyces fumanus TaxID=67302 RepID=A0A919DWQ3_9ACTN|nr:tellurite resistance/C4-dicarboxylate transporter family protein [Streptomyces fumanus]GHE92585.1 tellurite resistance protein permease [Streptomyces fumanus]